MSNHPKSDVPEVDELNFKALKQKSRHLDVVNELALELLHTSSLDDVLWVIARTAIANLGFDDCVIYLLDRDRNTLVQRAAHGPKNPSELDILNPIEIPLGEGIVGQVAKSGIAEVVGDTRIDSRYIVDDEMRLSEIAVPIFYEGIVIGVIDSEHQDTHFYTDEHLEVVTTIASMAATKIANAIAGEKLEELTHQLKYEATHDSLTGLLNRREYERRLTSFFDEIAPDDKVHVLCYADVNDFKKINDTYGHAAGDEYLKRIASIVRECVGDDHLCARIGGDEFSIFFSNITSAEAHHRCELFCDRIKGGHSRRHSDEQFAQLSVGMYTLEKNDSNISVAMGRADAACYAAKKNSTSSVCDYAQISEHLASEKAEISVVNWLRQAIENDQLRLVAQEIFHGDKSGSRRAFEILLRSAPEVPLNTSIASMLRTAERHGLSTRIDFWVVTKAFEWIELYQALVENSIDYISVNLSAESIENPSFQTFLVERLDKLPVSNSRICIEITENVAFSDIRSTARFVKKLRDMGCLTALDDFGSGLTSYDYLRHLAVDILKIDGIFVRNAASDPREAAMMASINELAHSLNMRTVAEHIEDAATFVLAQNTGIDYFQGYHLGMPTTLPEISDSLASRS